MSYEPLVLQLTKSVSDSTYLFITLASPLSVIDSLTPTFPLELGPARCNLRSDSRPVTKDSLFPREFLNLPATHCVSAG